MTAGRTPLPLALTMGDPAGIGPDIIIAAWHERRRRQLPPFVVYGDPEVFLSRSRALGVPLAVNTLVGGCALPVEDGDTLPLVSVASCGPVAPRHPSSAAAAATLAAIDRATADVISGRAAALVTAPITKAVLYDAGFRYPGHTEYLARLAEAAYPDERFHPVMMLACDELRVVPATVHIPLSRVPETLTATLIEETILITAASLRRDFGLEEPRIAVTGLNPHAGEEGAIGTEDRDLISPVISALAARGLHVFGPRPADTLFHAAARRTYDAVVAMYHDQALIPIKTIAFDTGVNVTLGLPFVRTSPDHGTAYDLAGTGRASAESLIAALKLANTMAARRISSTASRIG